MKKSNFEENLARLEKIVSEMEDENTGLESALALYKEGLAAAARANVTLEGIEAEVRVLQEDASPSSPRLP